MYTIFSSHHRTLLALSLAITIKHHKTNHLRYAIQSLQKGAENKIKQKDSVRNMLVKALQYFHLDPSQSGL